MLDRSKLLNRQAIRINEGGSSFSHLEKLSFEHYVSRIINVNSSCAIRCKILTKPHHLSWIKLAITFIT